jgi:hypothetical protein
MKDEMVGPVSPSDTPEGVSGTGQRGMYGLKCNGCGWYLMPDGTRGVDASGALVSSIEELNSLAKTHGWWMHYCPRCSR